MFIYEPYNPHIANVEDRIAWELCHIIDEYAPLTWTRYRAFAECIAQNEKLVADIIEFKNLLNKPVEYSGRNMR